MPHFSFGFDGGAGVPQRPKGIQMERREVVLGILALGAAGMPLRSSAQSAPRTYRVGVLSLFLPPPFAQLSKLLANLGYVEGRNLVIESAFADGQAGRLP